MFPAFEEGGDFRFEGGQLGGEAGIGERVPAVEVAIVQLSVEFLLAGLESGDF